MDFLSNKIYGAAILYRCCRHHQVTYRKVNFLILAFSIFLDNKGMIFLSFVKDRPPSSPDLTPSDNFFDDIAITNIF